MTNGGGEWASKGIFLSAVVAQKKHTAQKFTIKMGIGEEGAKTVRGVREMGWKSIFKYKIACTEKLRQARATRFFVVVKSINGTIAWQ